MREQLCTPKNVNISYIIVKLVKNSLRLKKLSGMNWNFGIVSTLGNTILVERILHYDIRRSIYFICDHSWWGLILSLQRDHTESFDFSSGK